MTDTISLYGDIGDSWWGDGITAKDVRSSLQELDRSANQHNVRINSMGGDVGEGLTIMNLLRAHAAALRLTNPSFKLQTVVDGYAMSSASVVFMAGDERHIALGGVVMIHEAWNFCGGDADEMRKTADTLDKLSANAADIYSALCVSSKERTSAYYRDLMKAETYMTGDEAVNMGLATSVDKGIEAVLLANFTPENMKGKDERGVSKYVAAMTTKRQHIYNTPRNTKQYLDHQAAMNLLKMTAIELGTTLTSVKI
jgi:ATP-dependent protease ClpP protease subunit